MSESRVAIAVVTHNRLASLRRTLDRLGDLPERPRIVLVDNGSSDGTAMAIERDYPSVELIRLTANHGSTARTIAADRIPEPYVAFADDDSWWHPSALTRAIDLLDRYPQVGLIAARVLVGDSQHEDPTCTAMARSPLSLENRLPGRRVLGFIACGSVVRQAALRDVGGFHPRFHTYAEELLLAVDMERHGWRSVYVPDVVAHHHPWPGDRRSRASLELRNTIWVAWLRRPLRRAVSITLRTAARCLTDHHARVALVEALIGAPWVLRERRVVSVELEESLQMLGY
jgi:GT2 family glycosyltransferase